MEQILDMIIIGSGPAGLAAAIYGKRAFLTLAVVEKEYGGTGQIAESGQVDNYPGLPGISGFDLGEQFREHAVSLGTEFIELEAVKIEEIHSAEEADAGKMTPADGREAEGRKDRTLWKITFEDGSTRLARTVVYAAGAAPRKMNVPGEAEFAGKGISFCAICDGAFYKDKTVAVIGGGDTALDDAVYLSKICQKVYLIHRRDTFRGAARTVEMVKKTGNIELVLNAVVQSFGGEKKLSKITLADGRQMEVDGAFMAIGSVPQTALLEGLVSKDTQGYVCADENGATGRLGLFVAGDVRTKKLRQVVTAAADGACAATSAAEYLRG
jgi:thioredoxin reductase (NADPH)